MAGWECFQKTGEHSWEFTLGLGKFSVWADKMVKYISMSDASNDKESQLQSNQDVSLFNLDSGWIDRVLKTSAVVTLLVALFLAHYYNYIFAVGFIIGSAWNMANLWLIKLLVSNLLTTGTTLSKGKLLLLAGVKFPVLYVGGYLILVYGKFPPVSLMAGFTLLFLVILLKASGLVWLSNQGTRKKGAFPHQ